MNTDKRIEFPGFSIRYNILPINSIRSFAGIRGGNNQGCKDVYFIRCIGNNSEYIKEIQEMDRILAERSRRCQGNYLRLQELPKLLDNNQILKYTELLNNWYASQKKNLVLDTMLQSLQAKDMLPCVLRRIEEEFIKCSPNTSQSMIRNFLTKILLLTDCVYDYLLKGRDGKNADKFVYGGSVKKQEYLFCYFLTLLGIDVLLLLPEGEPGVDQGLLDLSGSIYLEKMGACRIPSFQETIMQEKTAVFLPESAARSQELPSASGFRARPTLSAAVLAAGRPRGKERENQETQRSPKREENKGELEFEELALLASSVVMITIFDNKGTTAGTGSGIMIGEGGYILTNNHVAGGGASYSVRIEEEENTYMTDEVIKWNSMLDLAVIRIPRRLKPIPLYHRKELLVRGQKVVAIGSPLGLFNSVSNGIISGFREIRNVDMIQFTAPISHGSSGGALLNMYGELIGICTAGFDGGQNINLAVDYLNISRFVSGFV